MRRIIVSMLTGLTVMGVLGSRAEAADVGTLYPTAIFAFEERGKGVVGYGKKVGDVMFASLAVNPDLFLVDREEMGKLLQEHELNLSGMVNSSQAVQVGQLTGARVIVTGSIIEMDKTLYLVARIIGTETSRVLGESIKGRTSDEIGPLVEQLAEKVATTITEKADVLVAKPVRTEDRIATLARKMGDAKRPTILVRIPEMHIGTPVIDPAAETELTLFCRGAGFEVIDAKGSEKQADILITGEGFSEFAMRRGNLVSVKARLEVKAIDRATERIMAIDRQTTVEVDLTEMIAGKKALQSAAAAIAERMLPKLVQR